MTGKVWPTLRREPEHKLSDDERMRRMAEKRANFLINQLGPSAEILDAQNKELTGLSLRETIVEKEWGKLRDQVEAKKDCQRQYEAAKLQHETEATLDIIEHFNENYFLSIDGKRVKSLKKLEIKCPFCGTPHPRPRGALIELYEWRRNHMNAPSWYDLPVKDEPVVCPKCGKSFRLTAQLLY